MLGLARLRKRRHVAVTFHEHFSPIGKVNVSLQFTQTERGVCLSWAHVHISCVGDDRAATAAGDK